MEYLIQSEIGGNESAFHSTWIHLTDEDDFLKALEDPNKRFIACHDKTDGVNILRQEFDQGLNDPLSYVAGDFSLVTVKKYVPLVTRELDIRELKDLCIMYGRIQCSRDLITHTNEFDMEEEGFYTTDWGSNQIWEFSPSKIKKRKNQGKYYRRGRMRNGNIPHFIFQNLLWSLEYWLRMSELPSYQRGNGSSEGASSNFVALYRAMGRTELLHQMRSFYALGCETHGGMRDWVDSVEQASHYVTGCREKITWLDFADCIEEECTACEISIPVYKKGQKYE